MKKIALYINTFGIGGAERVMCNLATQLSKYGYDVILITSFAVKTEYECVKEVRRAYLNDKYVEHFVKRNVLLTRKLRHILKSECPDVLISFMAEPNFRAIIASIGLKNNLIISVRNDPNREYSSGLTRFLAKTLFRLANGIVFQTDEAQKWFPKSIQKNSKIIFNPVDDIFYHTSYEGERHNIVTAGRLTAQKNHKMLIYAFSQIADQISDNLIIYGEGELRSDLENLVSKLHMENRIFLPGSIKNVADTIKSARLFVLSSDYEGMPNALMEALVLGIPCISTDCPCGGSRTLISDGVNGFLVPIGDKEVLAEKMMQIANNDTIAQQFATKSISIRNKLNSDHIFNEWLNYIDFVIGRIQKKIKG